MEESRGLPTREARPGRCDDSHFTSQLGAVDKAIALTIDNDCDLNRNQILLRSAALVDFGCK
jgi:hypothetical protein